MINTHISVAILIANHISSLGGNGNVVSAELGLTIIEIVVQGVVLDARAMKLRTDKSRRNKSRLVE